MYEHSHKSPKKQTIFTIGHSTRTLEELIELLRAHEVRRVIDIRTIPRSRRNPQYNRETLGPGPASPAELDTCISKSLGGLRRAKPDSKNIGWHNASFRGYADYMQTPEFEAGLARAIKLSAVKPSALMCAEAVPWRCHRSLVADALAARKFPVEHITERCACQQAQTNFVCAACAARKLHIPRTSLSGVSRQLA